MAIKAISQFDAAIPTSNDKILFEQNGEGKSCNIGDAVNTCSLTYEEIMATTTNLSGKIASASVLKTLSDNLSGFAVLKSFHAHGSNFNIDDLSNYPRGTGLLNYSLFSHEATGAKPFVDGHLLTFIWRNSEVIGDNNFLTQIAIEDESTAIQIRCYDKSAKTWQAWKTVSIS